MNESCKKCLVQNLLKMTGGKESIKEYWKTKEDLKEFVMMVFEKQDLVNRMGQVDLTDKVDDYWYKVRKMLGERVIKTYSSAGGLKVGNGGFTMVIPNGNNADETRTAIFKKNEPVEKHLMNFTGIILDGDIDIYDFDKGDKVLGRINGRYEVYSYSGMIALIESVK